MPGERRLPFFVLGGGSNLVVADEGFPGLVVHIALRGVTQTGSRFRVAAGENWDGFVSRAVALNFGGIECLAGIPGTVGGTPVQNVGAYGQEVSGTIEQVRVLDLKDLHFAEMPASACGFAYRRSIFNSTERGRYVVTRRGLSAESRARLRSLAYADLQRHFRGSRGSANARRDSRRRAGDSARQRHAAGGRRAGLPQRGQLLQESRRAPGAL